MFGLSRLFRKPESPKAFGIRYLSLQKIFQLYNSELYAIGYDHQLDDPDILPLTAVLNTYGSPAADHFLNAGKIAITGRCFLAREDGPFISFVDYKIATEKGAEDRLVMAIGDLRFDDSDPPMIEPHYLLSGFCRTSGTEGLLFFPQESLTRTTLPDGEEIMLQAQTEDEFFSQICYADTLFQQVISGGPIDHEKVRSWLHPNEQLKSHQRFLYMQDRDFDSLGREIREGVHLSSASPAGAHP
jgi:hypothetical protein